MKTDVCGFTGYELSGYELRYVKRTTRASLRAIIVQELKKGRLDDEIRSLLTVYIAGLHVLGTGYLFWPGDFSTLDPFKHLWKHRDGELLATIIRDLGVMELIAELRAKNPERYSKAIAANERPLYVSEDGAL